MGDIVLDDDAIEAVNALLARSAWRVHRHGNIYSLFGPNDVSAQIDAADIPAELELFLASFLTGDTAPEGWPA